MLCHWCLFVRHDDGTHRVPPADSGCERSMKFRRRRKDFSLHSPMTAPEISISRLTSLFITLMFLLNRRPANRRVESLGSHQLQYWSRESLRYVSIPNSLVNLVFHRDHLYVPHLYSILFIFIVYDRRA